MLYPRINITEVRQLWSPQRVAQVITNRESYGTPVTDTYYPEARRQAWDDVTVPLSLITERTRAVPLVLRGAPGVTVPGDSGSISLIQPQPIKTVDGFTAADYNNRRLYGRATVEQFADRLTVRHTDIHRKTREALAAQSLTGRIDFPISGANGQVVDVFSLSFGAVHAWAPSVNWTAAGTTIGQIHRDLSDLRTERTRRGYRTDRIKIGRALFAALLDKVGAYANDGRVPARIAEDGSIQIGGFRLTEMAEQYDHPGLADFGQPGGAVPAGFKDVIGENELIADDTAAGWTMLSVRLDNFKMAPNPGPLGTVVEMSPDGGQLDLYFESKPFPIPPAPAISRGDATTPA